MGTAVLDLSTDESGLSKGLNDAEGTTKSKMGRIGGTIGKATKVAAAGFAAAGAAGIAAAFKTADYGDEIAKTATKLGISTDALQEQRYWAERNGISAQSMDRAVGRLNQRIGRAAAGNDKYAAAFKDLGVEIQDSEGKIRSTEDVMQDTISALRDIEDPAMQSAAASEIFGTKMARDLMPALQDGSLSLEEAAEKAHELGIVMDGESLEAAERFQDNWADVKDSVMGFVRQGAGPLMELLADRLFPFIRDTAVPMLQKFGDWIGPKIQAAAEKVTAFFDNVLVPAFQALVVWWSANGPTIISAVQDVWDGLQDILGRVKGLIDKVVGWFRSGEKGTTGSFASIMSFAQKTWPQIFEIISSAVELIRAVVEKVIGAVQAFWDRFGSHILDYAQRTWSRIQDLISAALNIIQGVIETVLGIITGDWSRAWEGIKQLVGGVWGAIKALVGQAIDIVKTVIGAAMAAISQLWAATWNTIKNAASAVWSAIKSKISNEINAIKTSITNALSAIKSAWSAAWNVAKNVASAVWSAIKSIVATQVAAIKGGISNAMSAIKGSISNALSAIKSAWSNAWNAAKTLVSNAWSRIKSAVSNGASNVLSTIRDIPGRIKSALGNMGSLLFSAGKDLIRGLINGIKNMAGNAARAAKDAVKSAVDGAKNVLRIGSPSKVFAEIGEDTIGGFLVGVDHEAPQVDRAIRDAISIPDADQPDGASVAGTSPMGDHHLKAIRRALERQAREPLVTAMNRSERLTA